MPDLGGLELLHEWRKVIDSLVSSAASGMANTAELPRQLIEPMQRQMELVQDVIERERRLQQEVVGRVLSPLDAVFDMLDQTGVMLREQAEAMEAAGRAIEQTAGLMKGQAELFERTLGAMREPTELARVAAGLERRSRRHRQAAGGDAH
jgi:hypothetical protein